MRIDEDGAPGAVGPDGEVKRADLGKDPSHVAAMFDHVSRRYDLMNDLMSVGMDRVWLVALAQAVAAEPGEEVLDLAAGTGASSAAIARSGAHVTACDLSEGMIGVGRTRHPEIDFVQGNAMDLPFDDASFEAVTISYGLRNMSDPELALREMARVTRPGGRMVVCEFSTPPNAAFRALYGIHQRTLMPALARAFSTDDVAYDYLVESIVDWPDQLHVARMIRRSGWDHVQYRNLTGGIVALHRAVRAIE